MSSSKEDFLEKKILMLERRLTLVERFVELRFCEDFRGFSGEREEEKVKDVEESIKGRNSKTSKRTRKIEKTSQQKKSDAPSDEATIIVQDKKKTTRSRSSFANRPAPASVKRVAAEANASKASSANVKDCVIRISRADEVSASGHSSKREKFPIIVKEESIGESVVAPRYNTRRKRVEEVIDAGPSRKNSRRNESPPSRTSAASVVVHHSTWDGDDADCATSPMEANYVGDEEDEAGYFTFPGVKIQPRSVEAEAENDDIGNDDYLGLQTNDLSDQEWSGDDVEDDDSENEQASAGVKSEPASKTRKPRASKGTKTRKPRKSTPASPKVPIKRKFASAIFSDVPTHAIVVSDLTKRECPMCHKHFKIEVIDNHMQSHMKERHLKCTQCDKAYFNHSMLRKHLRVHQPEKYSKKCRLCEKVFIQSDKVLAHERFCVKKALGRNEHVDPVIVEDLKKRSAPDWLTEAETSSQESPRKQCPHCKKMFKASFYSKHVKSHDIPKSWICNVCDKAYVHKHDLVRHFTTEHTPNPICEICGETYKDRATLKLHMKACRKEQREGLKIKKIASIKQNEALLNVEKEMSYSATEENSNSDEPVADSQPTLGSQSNSVDNDKNKSEYILPSDIDNQQTESESFPQPTLTLLRINPEENIPESELVELNIVSEEDNVASETVT